MYHVIKFPPYFSFTVYCFYTKISSFMLVLSTRIVLDFFYLLIFYSEKFSTDVCRLPYAVNVNLNLSNSSALTAKMKLFALFFLLGLLVVTFTHRLPDEQSLREKRWFWPQVIFLEIKNQIFISNIGTTLA